MQKIHLIMEVKEQTLAGYVLAECSNNAPRTAYINTWAGNLVEAVAFAEINANSANNKVELSENFQADLIVVTPFNCHRSSVQSCPT